MPKETAHTEADEQKREAADEQKREASESFWDQWGTTSLADVRRDTYGPDKRSSLERELRSDTE